MAIFTNQATLSYSGGTVSSNIATGEIVEVLAVNKTATAGEYAPGSDITYVINLINSGAAAITGLSVVDDLGAYAYGDPAITLRPLDYVDGTVRYFVNGVLQAAPTVTAGPPLTVSGITVPAGGNAAIVYTARANSFAPVAQGAAGILNTATVSGGGITPVEATAAVTPEEAPRLTITKSITPTTVAENGRVTYTFVVENFGNTAADADDNAVITDTFDPILTDLTVTYNGAQWADPANYTYNEATGLFSTVAGGITVPAATFTQDPVTGAFTVTPGTATLTVTGTV